MQKRVEGENDIQGEVWLTPGPGFQESSPSRITQDLTPRDESWQHVRSVTCQGHMLGTQSPRCLLKPGVIQAPSTEHTQSPRPPEENQIVYTNGFSTMSHSYDSGSFMSQCRVLFTSHDLRQEAGTTLVSRPFPGCTVSSRLCSLISAWPHGPVADHPVPLSPVCAELQGDILYLFLVTFGKYISHSL